MPSRYVTNAIVLQYAPARSACGGLFVGVWVDFSVELVAGILYVRLICLLSCCGYLLCLVYWSTNYTLSSKFILRIKPKSCAQYSQ
jgi:hypothetical protein